MADKKMVQLLCGAQAEDVQGEELKEIQKFQTYAGNGIILPLPGKPQMGKCYIKYEHYLYNFDFQPTDVFVAGAMKTGTTWLHEILWTMVHNIDLTNPKASENFILRLPFFEACAFLDLQSDNKAKEYFKGHSMLYNYENKGNYLDIFKHMESPRIIKTHSLPYLLNPKIFDTSKIVYIIRNPMDSFLSLYHFVQKMDHHHFNGTLEEFTTTYMEGKLFMGNAPLSMKQWWPYRNHKNVHFVRYEDLRKSPEIYMMKIAEFLGRNITEKQLSNVISQTDFKRMKENKSEYPEGDAPFVGQAEINKLFFREGKVGTAKDELPKEIYDKLVDYFTEELKDIDHPYKF